MRLNKHQFFYILLSILGVYLFYEGVIIFINFVHFSSVFFQSQISVFVLVFLSGLFSLGFIIASAILFVFSLKRNKVEVKRALIILPLFFVLHLGFAFGVAAVYSIKFQALKSENRALDQDMNELMDGAL